MESASRKEDLIRARAESAEHINAAQPIVHAGRPNGVVLATGYGKGAALFDVRRAGSTWEADGPVWESLALKAKFMTPVWKLAQPSLHGLMPLVKPGTVIAVQAL